MTAARPLNDARLRELQAAGVAVPTYDRRLVQPGVVHFGPGAFHRVHQAWYFDRALASDPRWGICEVALQTPGVRDALMPQDGLYTLAILDEARRFEIIGSIKEMRVARESPAQVLRRLSDPQTRLITSTVTEKGYCLRADGALDLQHPDIAHDLAHPATPQGLIGFIAAGLRARRDNDLPAPTIISCDNLSDNGKRLKRGVVEFCAQRDAELAAWIREQVAFPSSMVDSITPATNDELRALVATQLGVDDRWPVQREAFTQWVIEDDLRGEQPDWQALGVTVTDDVHGFERAKLRLLNGAHSALAYLGSLAGYETVAQAMQDTALAAFIETMMRQDIAPTLKAPRGLNIGAYIDAVLRRFRNPAIRHLLAQIAWDGSQKLPIRLLSTISESLAHGAGIDRLTVPIAAWMQFIRRKALRQERATDPLAVELLAIGEGTSGAANDAHAFLTIERMFPRELAQSSELVRAIERAYQRLNGVTTPTSLASALPR